MNSFWRIVLLGALAGVVSGDVPCFIMKQVPRIAELRQNYRGFTIELCRPAKNYFIGTEKDAKECSLKRISVDEALAFTKDLCTVGWDLNNDYLKHQECFGKNIGNAAECVKDLIPQELKPDKAIDYAKNVCGKLYDVFKCFNEKVGKPCGDEALSLTKRLTKAVSSLTTGACLEVNGTTFIKMQGNVLLGLLVAIMLWYKY